MKTLLCLSQCILISLGLAAQITVTEVAQLPESVSNNAVCEGFIDEVPYLYSFAGIDSTKIYSGIHLKSFRVNLETGEAIQLPDLPDTLGKIAAAASRVGDVIYIAGGYHVFANDSELSSNKMHRFDIQNNVFLEDGADIPVATDDQVQVVWRDSLIYLITGWNNTTNIRDVQIYNPAEDSWMAGTSVPNTNSYKSFGASGTIVGDTIYYFGGAQSTFGFNIQNKLRRGIINPDDPSQIEWSIFTPDFSIRGYRMAATTVRDELHWVGGSEVTYNFDGIAYNGTGGVSPANRDLYLKSDDMIWQQNDFEEIPMDLRGIAEINDTLKYLAGGMLSNQEVTNKVFRLEWPGMITSSNTIEVEDYSIEVFPNPFGEEINLYIDRSIIEAVDLTVYNSQGQLFWSSKESTNRLSIISAEWPAGMYLLKVLINGNSYSQKIIKLGN